MPKLDAPRFLAKSNRDFLPPDSPPSTCSASPKGSNEPTYGLETMLSVGSRPKGAKPKGEKPATAVAGSGAAEAASWWLRGRLSLSSRLRLKPNWPSPNEDNMRSKSGKGLA